MPTTIFGNLILRLLLLLDLLVSKQPAGRDSVHAEVVSRDVRSFIHCKEGYRRGDFPGLSHATQRCSGGNSFQIFGIPYGAPVYRS